MDLKNVKVSMRVFAEGVSGQAISVERYEGVSLNEAIYRMKAAYGDYDSIVKIEIATCKE